MQVFIDIVAQGLEHGLILSLIAIGVTISFRFLDFPDLTAEMAYPFAGSICAALIVADIHPGIATIAACICAGIAGILTALLHLRLKINTMLAGIIINTMIYSVNIKLMGHNPYIDLVNFENLFSTISGNKTDQLLSLLGLNAIVIIPILLFFQTGNGLRLRTVGANPHLAARNGIDVSKYTILGLFIGNALCGLSSSIVIQMQSYTDLSIGIGIVVQALAVLMIGELVINPDNIIKQISAPFIGAILYGQIQASAITAGFAESDLKFLTGAIVIIVLMVKKRDNF